MEIDIKERLDELVEKYNTVAFISGNIDIISDGEYGCFYRA